MSTAALNIAALEQSGVLPEEEYAKLAKTLSEALKGIRIQAVRKTLNFEPHQYTDYEKAIELDFNKKHRPVEDPDMAFDLPTIPLTFHAEISIDFFPEFERDYSCPDFFDRTVIERTEAGFQILPTNQFRSLLLANHQLEQEVRRRYKETSLAKDLSPYIEVECNWCTLPKLSMDIGDPVRLILTVFVLTDR